MTMGTLSPLQLRLGTPILCSLYELSSNILVSISVTIAAAAVQESHVFNGLRSLKY